MTTQQAVEKTKERIEEIIKGLVHDLHQSDDYWERKHGNTPYWEVGSTQLLSLIDDEREKARLEGYRESTRAEYQESQKLDKETQTESFINGFVAACHRFSPSGLCGEPSPEKGLSIKQFIEKNVAQFKSLVTNHLEEK